MLSFSPISSAFSGSREFSGQQYDSIVVINYGGTYHRFARRPAHIDGLPVYPLLKSHTDISESIDIYSKKTKTASVTVSLSDIEYKMTNNSGSMLRISDELPSLVNKEAAIYFLLGSRITTTTACLQVFSGVITKAPIIDRDTYSFTIDDNQKINEAILPSTLVSDIFTSDNVPTESRNLKIPLVFGEFKVEVTEKDLMLGGALAILTDWDGEGDYVISDHPLKSLTDLWTTNDVLPDPVKFDDTTLSTNDGGYGTAIGGPDVFAYVYPTWALENNPPSLGEGQYPTNIPLAWDRDLSTASVGKDFSDVGGVAQFGFNMRLENDSFIADTLRKEAAEFRIELAIDAHSGITLASPNTYNKVSLRGTEPEDSAPTTVFTSVPWYWQVGQSNTWQHGTFSSSASGKEGPFYIRVQGRTTVNADGVSKNQDLVDVYEGRLVLKYPVDKAALGWVSCTGATFGSWIDDTGRSNSYNSGDLIEDPVFIIESILRDQLGFTNDEIDTSSFDSAANSSVKAHVNVTEDVISSNLIRNISEQSTFMITYSAAGQIRAIPLNNTTPTIRGTIPRGDIVKDNIKITRTNTIINSMDIESRWLGEKDLFLDRNTVTNSTSITSFGTRAAKYDWQYIAKTSKDHVADHYVGNSNGIWANDHIVVEFVTPGYKYAHLEAGDWIRLAKDVDNIRKAFGDTWENKNLMITSIRKGQYSTKITALELY